MKSPTHIIKCPTCGRQGIVRTITKLPRGYDDPGNPISVLPVNQALIHDVEIAWPKKEKK